MPPGRGPPRRSAVPRIARQAGSERARLHGRTIGVAGRQLAAGQGRVAQRDQQALLAVQQQQIALRAVRLEHERKARARFGHGGNGQHLRRQRTRGLQPRPGQPCAQPLAEDRRARGVAGAAKGAQQARAIGMGGEQPVRLAQVRAEGVQHDLVGRRLPHLAHHGPGERVRQIVRRRRGRIAGHGASLREGRFRLKMGHHRRRTAEWKAAPAAPAAPLASRLIRRFPASTG